MSWRNKGVHWSKMEKMYRAGVLSTSEIAREFNMSEANVRYHAKKRGWQRDLTKEVREATRIKMVQDLATARVEGTEEDRKEVLKSLIGATDDQIIEEAAKTQVEVVRQHQKTLGSGHSLTMRMLNELDATTTYQGDLEKQIKSSIAPMRQRAVMNAISLGGRAVVMRDLAIAAKTWVILERQAFNIADDRDKDNKDQRKLDEMTADQLRKEIVEDAKKLGLELTSEQFSQGVVTNGSGKPH